MLSVSRFVSQSPPSFGKHCGELPPLVNDRHFGRNTLEANLSRSPTTPEGYPSPPMSGSPPSSAAAPREASSSYYPAYSPRAPSEELPALWREDQHDPRRPSATPSASQFSDHSYHMRNHQYSHAPSQQDPSFITQHKQPHAPEQPTHSYPPSSTHAPVTSNLAIAGSSSTGDQPHITSPKAQRKAKGHVASACKPCKKAHLRCDAQRPCLRCSKNGKEHDCVDVQHKKRGRPRLPKEDPHKYQHLHELSARKPSSTYPTNAMRPAGYEHGPRHRHRLRSMDYGQRVASSPAHLERFVHGRPEYPPVPPLPEPVAYLNMNLEFVKVSPTFDDALAARSSIVGRRLADIVAQSDIDRISTLCNTFAAEQKRREPNYLPPIFGTSDQALQNLYFSREAVSQVQFDRDEYFGFSTPEGYLRPHSIRFGLLKSGSMYFIAATLNMPRAPQSDMPRDPRTRQYPLPQMPPIPTTLPPPSTSQYDPTRRVYSDESVYVPQTLSSAVQTTSPPHSSYSPSPRRGDYVSHPASQIPRSELPTAPNPMPQPYQLPPIRPSAEVPSAKPSQIAPIRDERPRRLTIGGLLDSPDNTRG